MKYRKIQTEEEFAEFLIEYRKDPFNFEFQAMHFEWTHRDTIPQIQPPPPQEQYMDKVYPALSPEEREQKTLPVV